jgi:hypothetical protein
VRRVAASIDHAQAALAAARGAGLAVERGEVARVASNVLVRLEPGPFAARLTGATEGFRDSAANLRRGSDWEDAHLAPLEWDLGCLVAAARVHGNDFGWAEAALLAHGGPFDADLLEACVDARVAQGAAYLAATGRGDVRGHLEWLGVAS